MLPRAAAAPRVGLDQLLREHPYRFSFFQALRILERLHEDRQPIGQDHVPQDEIVRLRAHLSLVFPPSELTRLEFPSGEPPRPPELTVAFLGLTGPSGALPRSYTELLLERVRGKDRTLRDFLDLFNHRLLSLFYRAWEKYRFWLAFERADRLQTRALQRGEQQLRWFVTSERPRVDLFSQILLDLPGLGTPALRYRTHVRERLAPRMELADETLRFYAGLLAQRHRSASGLESMVQGYFHLPARVLQFRGQWVALDTEFQSQLVPGGNAQLGVNAVAGSRVWDVQSKFCIRLGPLDYAAFQIFMPSGPGYRPLAQMARLYAGQQFDFDIQPVLKADHVPWCRLGGDGAAARLGWNTWIRNQPIPRDAEDAVFRVEDDVSCGL